MSNITIEGADDFQQEVVFADKAKAQARTRQWNRVKKVSKQVRANIKIKMPVRTGFAKARWGTPSYIGGLWQESESSLTIVQGAALLPFEYISRLNEGYSKQAPAGFIDTEVALAVDALSNELLQAMVEVWEELPEELESPGMRREVINERFIVK